MTFKSTIFGLPAANMKPLETVSIRGNPDIHICARRFTASHPLLNVEIHEVIIGNTIIFENLSLQQLLDKRFSCTIMPTQLLKVKLTNKSASPEKLFLAVIGDGYYG